MTSAVVTRRCVSGVFTERPDSIDRGQIGLLPSKIPVPETPER
jgi:hypothetical protein